MQFSHLAPVLRHVRELGASSESKKKRDCDYALLCGIMRNYARKLCGIMHYYAFSGRIALKSYIHVCNKYVHVCAVYVLIPVG